MFMNVLMFANFFLSGSLCILFTLYSSVVELSDIDQVINQPGELVTFDSDLQRRSSLAIITFQ